MKPAQCVASGARLRQGSAIRMLLFLGWMLGSVLLTIASGSDSYVRECGENPMRNMHRMAGGSEKSLMFLLSKMRSADENAFESLSQQMRGYASCISRVDTSYFRKRSSSPLSKRSSTPSTASASSSPNFGPGVESDFRPGSDGSNFRPGASDSGSFRAGSSDFRSGSPDSDSFLPGSSPPAWRCELDVDSPIQTSCLELLTSSRTPDVTAPYDVTWAAYLALDPEMEREMQAEEGVGEDLGAYLSPIRLESREERTEKRGLILNRDSDKQCMQFKLCVRLMTSLLGGD